MSADENSLSLLVEEMNGDLRQILGFLQVWQKKADNTFIYASFKDQARKFGKDKAVTVSNFDAATMLMNSEQRRNKSYKELIGYFFIDYDLVPLLVQENYLSAAGNSRECDLPFLKKMARAAHSFTKADKSNLLVRRDQNWKLLDTVGFNSCVLPCHLVCQYMPFAKFPEFYGRFSSEKKMVRELKELKHAMMDSISGGQDAIKFDYGPAVLNLLQTCMKKGDDLALDQALEIYDHYGLTPELAKEHLVDIIFNPKKLNLLDGIDSKVKGAFTRLYNSKFKESLVHKKKRAVLDETDLVEGETPAEEAEPEAEQEGSEESFEIEKVKPTKKAATKKQDKKDATKKDAPKRK